MAESFVDDSRSNVLRSLPLFSNFGASDIAALNRSGAWMRYEPGQAIAFQGDECNSMLIVVSGFVSLSFASDDGREVIVAEAARGEVLGGAELMLGRRYLANALASSPTLLFSLRRATFVDLLRNQALCFAMLAEVCDRWCRLSHFAEAMSLRSVEQRLASLLVGLCRSQGTPIRDGMLIDPAVSQTRMAQLINASRPKVNVQLQSWKDEAVISLERRTLVVKNMRALETIAVPPS